MTTEQLGDPGTIVAALEAIGEEKRDQPDVVSAEAADPAEATEESEQLTRKIQSLRAAVWILAALGCIALLYWARSFFIPLCFGIVLAYTMRPAVDRLTSLGLPRAACALIVCLTLVSVSTYAIYTLRDDAAALLEQVPQAVKKVRLSVQNSGEKPRTLVRVREAANELDKAAAEVSGQPAPSARPAQAGPGMADKVQAYALQQGMSLAELVAQLFFSVLLAYYLLSEGDSFKRRLLKLVGPSLQRKKITVRILDDINLQVQRYMVSMLIVNTLMGMIVGVGFYFLGLNFSLLWGIAAALLHFIPYVGQGILVVGSGLAAYLQFESAGQAAAVVCITMFTSFFIGMIFLNWLQSRLSRISPTLLFVAILFFGWLWGAWGLLLAYPIVAIIKSVCDHVEGLRPFGEFMARGILPHRTDS